MIQDSPCIGERSLCQAQYKEKTPPAGITTPVQYVPLLVVEVLSNTRYFRPEFGFLKFPMQEGDDIFQFKAAPLLVFRSADTLHRGCRGE